MGDSAMSAYSSVARSPLSIRRLMMSVGRGSCPCRSDQPDVHKGHTVLEHLLLSLDTKYGRGCPAGLFEAFETGQHQARMPCDDECFNTTLNAASYT